MKNLMIPVLILLVSVTHAQVTAISETQSSEYTYTIKGKASETLLSISNLFADMSFEGTNSSEIRIVAMDYEGLPEKAKGLKPLSATGPENTGIGLSISQDGDVITLSGAHRAADDAEYKILLPSNIKLKVDYNSWQAGDVTVKGMTNEVELKSQIGDLIIEDVTGPIVANTLSSDIEVRFSSVNQTAPSSITSTSGDIDVYIPASSKGTFDMSSTSGGVYTDLDFDLGEEPIRKIGGVSATGQLNGGGVKITLRSISGDIYVRESK